MPDTVMFTGHRHLKAPAAVSAELFNVVSALYDKGVRHFITGGAIGFDTYAALAVIRLTARHPDVYLDLALVATDQTEKWSASDRRIYNEIIDHSSSHVFLCKSVLQDDSYRIRNYYMVDNADLCVAYLSHASSGTVMTVNYAKHKGLPILNLASPEYDLDAFVRSL